jgi:hypothetical protein
MGLPLVSVVVFGLGAFIAIPVGYETGYSDLSIWGWLSAALGVCSFFGYREKKRKAARASLT